ncbi:hypothetical protein LOTGIDRAFT_232099 [Lottia gigantea]|uniref:Uncharacterized protein n=1 Tax=Lottia gigantea TaxID=225164 RepID=V4AL41_LOTGI|nr:hypothetical protein LOTGIDRAFT_232099 [Lottia gigantea]ESO95460.1 hypothetical protein LOTGIDRAFT_232099 [Lottia gigantea]
MLGIHDYTRFVAFVAITVILALRDISVWMLADSILTALTGIFMLFLPSFIFDLETDGVKLDGLHIYFIRLTGCGMIAMATVLFIFRNSTDRNAVRTLLWSRTIAFGLATVRIIFDRMMHSSNYTDFHMLYSMAASAVWFAGQSYQLYQNGMEAPSNPSTNSVKKYYLMDTILNALGAVPDVFVPWLILPAGKDIAHQHYFALMGSFNVGFCVLTWCASSFRFDEDKRTVFCARLTAVTMGLFCFLYGTTREGLCPVWSEYILALFGYPIFLIINFAGIYAIRQHRSSLQANYDLRPRN